MLRCAMRSAPCRVNRRGCDRKDAAHHRIGSGMRVLVDSRKVVPADSVEVVKHMAAVARTAAVKLDCGALALVVNSDVGYGMCRMYMALTEARHPNTQVFRDYDEAVSWLKSQPDTRGGTDSSRKKTKPDT